MTGTVQDGNIDVALLRTDGERVFAFGPYALYPYAADVRALIAEAVSAARLWRFEGKEPAVFAAAEAALTEAQAEAVARLLEQWRIGRREVALVGLHGQTVLHRAPAPGLPGRTRQLGDGALMAARLGIEVAWDFRSADVAAGGQGAPLSASYHAALMAALPDPAGLAVLNLGGVANVTARDRSGAPIAFDTGPANGPIDDWVRRHGAGEMDRDGALARAGRVDEARLARLLSHPWLAAPWPKSLDRYDFTADMAEGLSLADGAATLAAFVAAAVGRALDLLPVRPSRLAVCGGGRHNPALMEAIAARAGVASAPAEALGWRGDAIEAECFAFLAMRVSRGLPISFPATTGVKRPMTGGRTASASR